MEHPRITIIVAGKTYSLCASNPEALGNIPSDDRQHLINLLEAVKYQDSQSPATAPTTPGKLKITRPATPPAGIAVSQVPRGDTKSARLGSGDIDALMDRLIMEEKQSRKPGFTRLGIYKVMGGLLLLVFLLVAVL